MDDIRNQIEQAEILRTTGDRQGILGNVDGTSFRR